MLEAVRPSWHKLRVLLHLSFGGIVMVVMVRVPGYAATTVVGWHESLEAAADDAFSMLTGDIGNARDRGAVFAPGRVRGEGHHATTTCNMDMSSALDLFSISFLRARAVTRPRPVPAQTRQAETKI